MHDPSFAALVGLIAWALTLLVLMEVLRSRLVITGRVPANGFLPDNANLSPFMQRLSRAHANCIEGLPIFGGLLVTAIATDLHAITDPLAYALLIARICQSVVHLISVSATAVTLRFVAFAVQMAIAAAWACELLIAAV